MPRRRSVAGEPGMGGTAGSNLKGPCAPRAIRLPPLRPQLELGAEELAECEDVGDAGSVSELLLLLLLLLFARE